MFYFNFFSLRVVKLLLLVVILDISLFTTTSQAAAQQTGAGEQKEKKTLVVEQINLYFDRSSNEFIDMSITSEIEGDGIPLVRSYFNFIYDMNLAPLDRELSLEEEEIAKVIDLNKQELIFSFLSFLSCPYLIKEISSLYRG